MDILEIAYIANPILIFLMAIGLGFYLTRRFNLGWRLFFIGGATYLASQLVSILLLGAIQNQIKSITPTLVSQVLITLLFVIILMTIEEGIRYGMFRWWVKDIRSWAEGLVIGSGHGGVEVILIGLMAITAFVQLLPLRHSDLSTVFTPDKLEQATQYVNTYWSKHWYNVLADAVRSGLTLPIQVACSILVLQVFLRQQHRWLGYAIGWHTLASAPLFFINSDKYVYLPLIFIAIVTVVSIGLIIRLQPSADAQT